MIDFKEAENIHSIIIEKFGGSEGLRDRNGLEAALNRPFATFDGNDLYPDIISKAAVCVYPSHIEAFGIACLEGMAAGKAVVTSNTGPGPEVLQDEISGLFCNPFDPRSIAGKVISLLTDPGLRRRLGEQARLRALNLFSIDALAERNEIFYQRCLEEHSRG